MKTLLNELQKQEVISRINSLKNNDRALWGKMTVDGMICHLADQIKVGLGIKESKDVSSFALRNIAKPLILLGMPAPKGKVTTVPEMAQEIQGTPPKEFEEDKKSLLNFIEQITKMENPIAHPAFGKMNKKQWNRLAYLHINHHLKQFGV